MGVCGDKVKAYKAEGWTYGASFASITLADISVAAHENEGKDSFHFQCTDEDGTYWYVMYREHVEDEEEVAPTSSITGLVTDEDMVEYIVGADVTDGVTTVKTGTDGRYRINVVPSASLTLFVSADGYVTAQQGVTSKAEGSKVVNLKLKKVEEEEEEPLPLPKVIGTVVDSVSGEPIEMAEITNNILTALAQSDGTYEIEVAPSASVTLECSFVGYHPKTVTVSTPETGTKTVNFALRLLEVPEPEPEPEPLEKPLWEWLTEAASDLITAKRTLAEIMGFTQLQEFADMVVEEFGDEIMPGGKKVIIFIPGTAVKKALPKVTEKASRNIAELTMRSGASRYSDYTDEALDSAVHNLMAMTAEGRAEVVRKLSKYPDGRKAVEAVLSKFAEKTETVMPAKAKTTLVEAAVKGGLENDVAMAVHKKMVNKAAAEIIAKETPLLEKVWKAKKALPLAFAGVIGAIGALYSYVFSVEWTVKEGLNEVLSIPTWSLLKDAPFSMSDEDLEKVNNEYIPQLRENAKHGRVAIDAVKGLWPFTKGIWTMYEDNVDTQIELYQEMYDIEKKRREEEELVEEKVNFYITTSPVADKVTVNFDELAYDGYKYTGTFGAGRFVIHIEKEGYIPIEEVVVLTAGEDFTRSYELVALEQKVNVEIVTVPGYVDVYIDDKFIDMTDALGKTSFLWDAGTYQFKFHRDGWEDRIEPVDLYEGMTKRLDITLKEIVIKPTEGILIVLSDPSAVDIYIAGAKIGATDGSGNFTAELTPFAGDIEFRKEGYHTRTKHVILSAGKQTTVTVTMTPEEIEKWLWKLDILADDEAGNPLHPKILINGSFTDKWAPDYVLLAPGTYTIMLELSGYAPWTTDIVLDEIVD